MNVLSRRLLALAAVLATTIPLSPAAAAFPDRPIRLVVPFPPGGTTDVLARVIADPLGQALGTTVVVENRNGAAGRIGTEYVVRADPDGYTLGIATVSSTAITPVVYKNLSYDVLTDLAPITRLAAVPNVLVVSPSLGVNDMAAFVAKLKSEPNKHMYGHAGTGSEAHMMGALFLQSTQTTMTAVPYRGSSPALQDALGGQVSAVFDNLPSSLPFIQAKKLTPLAIAYPKRIEALPDVPTFAEVGLAPVNDASFFGLVAPGKTPPAVIDQINQAIVAVLKQPEVRNKLAGFSAEPVGNSPTAFGAELRAELEKQREIAAKANISLE